MHNVLVPNLYVRIYADGLFESNFSVKCTLLICFRHRPVQHPSLADPLVSHESQALSPGHPDLSDADSEL